MPLLLLTRPVSSGFGNLASISLRVTLASSFTAMSLDVWLLMVVLREASVRDGGCVVEVEVVVVDVLFMLLGNKDFHRVE